MKISGKNLKRRLYGVSRLRDRVKRARYFRGHGVHSPFVYSIVRQVFMRSTFITDDPRCTEELYGRFSECGIPRKRVLQLVNLAVHCGYKDISVGEALAGDLIVVPQSIGTSEFPKYVNAACECGATLAIIAPYLNRERDLACREIVAAHKGTSIDNRGYLLIFNNHLPKQHFRL